MKTKNLAVIVSGVAVGVIGVSSAHQQYTKGHIAKNKNLTVKNNIVLMKVSHQESAQSSFVDYVSSKENRDKAWDEALDLHNEIKTNNCVFYMSSILRGMGYDVPDYIGYTTYFSDWLAQNGWHKEYNLNNIKPGDIAFSGETHVVMFLSWANKAKGIANVNDEQVVAYNNGLSYQRNIVHGAVDDGYIPGEGNESSYMRTTYYMTRDDNSVASDNLIGQTTINSAIGYLNFRRGNSLDYSVISKIPTGTQVDVLERKGEWYKVKYDGNIGWIYSSYTTGISNSGNNASSANPIISGKKYETTIDSSIGWLNFRTGNSTSYNIISKIPTGTTVSILGEQDGWYKISYDAEIGWISGHYTTGERAVSDSKQESIGKTTIESSLGWLRLRVGNGTGFSEIGKIPTGVSISVLSKLGGWYKVIYNGQVGWCYSGYTTGLRTA
ncbi:MAG: SH3 domain-containing protein [Sarcina sp.]